MPRLRLCPSRWSRWQRCGMTHNLNERTHVAKLLQLSRPNRRVGNIVRTWWALRSQRRRRHARNGTPAAPVIVGRTFEFMGAAWWDVVLDFTFDQGGFPDGVIEVFLAWESGGWVSNYVGEVASTERSYRHAEAFDDYTHNANVAYTMRYRCGEVMGPFSPAYPMTFDAAV